MQDLRLRQANGEVPEMVPANVDISYEIREDEQHLVHVAIRIDDYINPRTNKPDGTNRGITRIQKFYPNHFNQMSKTEMKDGEKGNAQNAFGAYDYVKVIHDPRQQSEARKEKVSNDSEKSPTDYNGKDLTEMTIDELRIVYGYITGNVAQEEDTAAQLLQLIFEAKQNRENPPTEDKKKKK